MGHRITTNAPSRDPRRTDDCLPFTALAELAEKHAEEDKVPPQNEHIDTCSYCQAVIFALQKQQVLIGSVPIHVAAPYKCSALTQIALIQADLPTTSVDGEDEE